MSIKFPKLSSALLLFVVVVLLIMLAYVVRLHRFSSFFKSWYNYVLGPKSPIESRRPAPK